MSQQDTEPSLPAGEDQPGALRADVILTLETRQAQRMVKGRPGTVDKPAIMGLIGFANRLRVIWHGARADDPYDPFAHPCVSATRTPIVVRSWLRRTIDSYVPCSLPGTSAS